MKKDVYNLSKPQESIWLTEQYYKNTNINRIIAITDFSSKATSVDFRLMKIVLNHMIKSNDNFQTRLFLDNGNVKQYFCDFEEIDFPFIEIESLDSLIEQEKNRNNVFDVLNGPLYEFKIYKIKGTNTGGIFGNFHHLICDALTIGLSAKQFTYAYNTLVETGSLPDLNPDNNSYIDYIKSENEYIKSEKFAKDKAYWDEIFKTVPEIATIYTSRDSKSLLNPDARRETFIIDSSFMDKINNLCTNLKISLYAFFMAVFGIYIGRVSRLDDFAIGTPILNRTNFKEKNTLGMFISTVPFRMTLKDDLSFKDFSAKTSKDTMSMLRHQKYSYGYILEELRKRDSSLPGLYSIMLSYQITKASDDSSNYSTMWEFNNSVNDDLDIHIYDINDENSVSISYDYNINKYESKDISAIHPRIMHIIEQVIENENILVKDIDIVTPSEKKQILNDFNNTKTIYPSEKSVISLFLEQVKKTQNARAVTFENNYLTYKDLNERANSLANILKKNGVKAHDIVSIYLDKSLEAIVSIVAILKLGACYMPIDISYPEDRILYMIKDASCKVLLTSSDLKLDIHPDIPVILTDLNSSFYLENKDFSDYTGSPNDLAYIIYTSGSTGKPKGVMVTNKNIVRLVKNTNYVQFSKDDKILQTGTIAFDASTFEIWGALLNGIEFFLLKKTDLLNPNYFSKYLKEHSITILFLTTALFNKFCEADPEMFNSLKYLFVGGEAYSFRHFKLAREKNPNLIFSHVYGPTENTTFSTFYEMKDLSSGIAPIGYPIANSTCYVMSCSGSIQPIGVPGELWVGGDGVSLGYLNREDLTNQTFIKNPFGEGKMYKTGDLVYMLPDGAINYIGRIDNQIKLRGFRIELSEIDSKILSFPGIKESISIINNQNICSYIVCDVKISMDDLKNHLRKLLPTYMVPNYITKLDSLPLNINGKVDKKRLPSPTLEEDKANYVPARNEIDKIIIEELKGILRLSNISIKSSFFAIGGDSLSAISLSTHLTDKLKVSVSVKDIFDHPVIESLSDFISDNNNVYSKEIVVKKSEKRDFYPVSCAEKRIYFANMVAGEKNVVYNVSGGLLFKKKLDISKVQDVLNKLVDMHSSFRTSFKYINRRTYANN